MYDTVRKSCWFLFFFTHFGRYLFSVRLQLSQFIKIESSPTQMRKTVIETLAEYYALSEWKQRADVYGKEKVLTTARKVMSSEQSREYK
jgi:hypothetical protein